MRREPVVLRILREMELSLGFYMFKNSYRMAQVVQTLGSLADILDQIFISVSNKSQGFDSYRKHTHVIGYFLKSQEPCPCKQK